MQSGTQLGHYEILSAIGKGGMGEVWKARDTKLGREVAIKFVAGDLADASTRLRFKQESRMVSSLNHPHIMTVHDVGEFEQRQYLVTEYVDAGTLKEWASTEKRTWRPIVELLTGVADGLAAAHGAGILHRDVKPANILIAKNGYAKLADFGLAKLCESDADVTRTFTDVTQAGAVVGTMAYMSPEQAAGKELDARSDVFSFGVVLYEALSGHKAFVGATGNDLLNAVAHAEPEPLGNEVPLALRMLVEKSLEKDPDHRYQSMREMVVDLRRLLRQRPVEQPGEVVSSPSRLWLMPSAVAVALALVLGVWVMDPGEPAFENPLANAQFTPLTDFDGDENDAAISPDGRFVVFRSDREGQFDLFVTQVGTGRFVNLTNGAVNVIRGAVRNIGFSYDGSEIWLMGGTGENMELLPLLGGAPRSFLSERAVNVSWTTDGSRMAYHTADAGDPLFVADCIGANPRQISVNPAQDGHLHFPIFSQDGSWIYFVSGPWTGTEMDLWRIPAEGGQEERLTNHNNNVRYPTPITDSTVLYVSPADDGSGPWMYALDVESRVTRRVSFGLEKYTSLSASADGRRVVATVANPSANLWTIPVLDRLVEEEDVESLEVPSVRARGPRFGGQSLFYLSSTGSGDGLWRYEEGEDAIQLWDGAEEALLEPTAVSPDGLQATLILRREGRRLLHLIDIDGAAPRAIAESVEIQGASSWSPDGRWIATGGRDAEGAGLFKIPVNGGEPERLFQGAAFHPVWSPDNDLIVFTGPLVGLFAPMLAVRPDGTTVDLPAIQLRQQGQRYRFLPDGHLVFMQGANPWQDFWMLDTQTLETRQLSRLNGRAAMQTFDISPDGRSIVFDSLRENSDIVLIDLP